MISEKHESTKSPGDPNAGNTIPDIYLNEFALKVAETEQENARLRKRPSYSELATTMLLGGLLVSATVMTFALAPIPPAWPVLGALAAAFHTTSVFTALGMSAAAGAIYAFGSSVVGVIVSGITTVAKSCSETAKNLSSRFSSWFNENILQYPPSKLTQEEELKREVTNAAKNAHELEGRFTQLELEKKRKAYSLVKEVGENLQEKERIGNVKKTVRSVSGKLNNIQDTIGEQLGDQGMFSKAHTETKSHAHKHSAEKTMGKEGEEVKHQPKTK